MDRGSDNGTSRVLRSCEEISKCFCDEMDVAVEWYPKWIWTSKSWESMSFDQWLSDAVPFPMCSSSRSRIQTQASPPTPSQSLSTFHCHFLGPLNARIFPRSTQNPPIVKWTFASPIPKTYLNAGSHEPQSKSASARFEDWLEPLLEGANRARKVWGKSIKGGKCKTGLKMVLSLDGDRARVEVEGGETADSDVEIWVIVSKDNFNWSNEVSSDSALAFIFNSRVRNGGGMNRGGKYHSDGIARFYQVVMVIIDEGLSFWIELANF